MRGYVQSSRPRRRPKYNINWKRFGAFIAVVLLIIVFIIYIINPDLFSNQYRVADMKADHLEAYFKAARDQKVPWIYLAAVDRAENVPESEITAERSANIGIYLKDIENTDQLKGMLESYNSDKKFLSRVEREVKKFSYLNNIYKDKVFPIVLDYEYTYEDGFGAGRSYGGERTHEGIDIMCDFDVPIVSVGDGVVEKIGWLELGGWRLYIKGDDGVHYYYAHMSKYVPGIKKGSKVKRGQTIGYVGDTGYGPTGTTGKFEPHLHFGMYEKEKAVNAYPFLKAWEIYKVKLSSD